MSNELKVQVVVLVIALIFPLSSIFFGYDGEKATRILESNGFTNITTGNHSMFSCIQDFYATKFTATGLNGAPVSGVVCGGLLFKDNTIRFN